MKDDHTPLLLHVPGITPLHGIFRAHHSNSPPHHLPVTKNHFNVGDGGVIANNNVSAEQQQPLLVDKENLTSPNHQPPFFVFAEASPPSQKQNTVLENYQGLEKEHSRNQSLATALDLTKEDPMCHSLSLEKGRIVCSYSHNNDLQPFLDDAQQRQREDDEDDEEDKLFAASAAVNYFIIVNSVGQWKYSVKRCRKSLGLLEEEMNEQQDEKALENTDNVDSYFLNTAVVLPDDDDLFYNELPVRKTTIVSRKRKSGEWGNSYSTTLSEKQALQFYSILIDRIPRETLLCVPWFVDYYSHIAKSFPAANH